MPPEARWQHLKGQTKQSTIGQLVDDAMAGLERDNPSLKGVLPKDYARPALDKQRLGQLNTFVCWYKRNVMTEGDNPPIGILLCTRKDHALVEYALADMDNRLFVSKYQIELPSREEIQRFLETELQEAGDGN